MALSVVEEELGARDAILLHRTMFPSISAKSRYV